MPGTYTYSNGTKYVGEWKADKHDGRGEIRMATNACKKMAVNSDGR